MHYSLCLIKSIHIEISLFTQCHGNRAKGQSYYEINEPAAQRTCFWRNPCNRIKSSSRCSTSSFICSFV